MSTSYEDYASPSFPAKDTTAAAAGAESTARGSNDSRTGPAVSVSDAALGHEAIEGCGRGGGSISQKVCSSLRTAEIAVLEAASDRFDEYLTDRHYSNEEAVLQDLLPSTSAKRLIRAVAEWRIAKREGA